MGNCIARCCGKFDKRNKYVRTRYNVEQDFSIEFENLMDDEPEDEMNKPLTDHEKELLATKQFEALLHEQWKLNADVDAKLTQQEEEIERDEEAYYEARRQAARVAKLHKAREEAARKNATTNGLGRAWLGEDEADWQVAGGEDDFEIFLASVKARSLAARAQLKQASGAHDAQSSSSSTVQTRDKTEGSSLELEWEHEAGMEPQQKPRSATEESLLGMTTKSSSTATDSAATSNSNELEWDNDFVGAEELEREQLLQSS